VGRIEVRGNQALETETVKAMLESEEGDLYSVEKVTADIHALYASGFIQDVVVEKNYDADGRVILTYTIKEKPIIHEVRFEGTKALSDEEIKNLSDLKARQAYDPARARAVRTKLLEEYSKQGYFMARVDIVVEEVSPGQVDVVFIFDEGKKPTGKDIKFFGNEKIKDWKLRARMATKREGVFTGKKFSREDFLRDLLVLDYYYDDNGYLEAAFDPAERMVTADREHVVLGLGIEEGLQYKVGEYNVAGDMIVPEEELVKGFLLKPGDIFRKSLFIRDQQYLLDFYGEEGYALCEAEPEVKLVREDQRVDITWHIRKGTKVYIETIEMSGNEKTYDKVIRREMTVKEGQLYNTSQVRRSQGRIKQLGYFSDVQIIPRPGSEPNRIKLDVAVKEQSSGSLVFGAGITTASEYFLSLQYNQKNFLGLGLDMTAQAMISQETQNYTLRYADPYFLDSNWYLGFEIFATEDYYVSFIDQRQGGSVTVGRELPHFDNIRFYTSYSYQTINLKGFDTDTIYDKQPANTNIGRLAFILDRNNLNNMLDPTSGTRQRVQVEFAGFGLFGGSHDFIKSSLEAWWFAQVYGGTYCSFRTRWRFMSYNKDDSLLISERYFMGGSKSLRGYEVGSVSPGFREDNGDITPIGGNKDVLFSAEYVIPLSEELGMKLAFFYDIGNVYNDNEDIDLGNMLSDWGVAIKWISPMGPLVLGVAFPIERREDDEPQQFVFSLGTIY
jgi:outer membrane protein insertion porin family